MCDLPAPSGAKTATVTVNHDISGEPPLAITLSAEGICVGASCDDADAGVSDPVDAGGADDIDAGAPGNDAGVPGAASGRQRRQARKPASSAAAAHAKKMQFDGRGARAGQTGRQ